MNAITIAAPRLPYHPAVQERFGVDQGAWRVLTDAVFPAAEQPESIIMALAYCRARNLDIFKKPVQIVPIYDRKRKRMVDTVWPGIAELRTTAMRTGAFAGFEETVFGPELESDLSGTVMRYPEWAQCTVYRLVGGHRVPFVGPKVYWLETYATAGRDTSAPNSMWKKRPRGQVEKCAEAAALRRAFPEELGGEYAAEEIEGQALGNVRDITLSGQTSGLAARLTAPQAETVTEGFTAHHPVETDDEAEDDTPAPDADSGEVTDDSFPGDAPGAGEGEGAGSAEAVADDPEPAPDPALAWADKTIGEMAFMKLAELKELQEKRTYKAGVAALRVQRPVKADEVEKALADALEAFG